MTLFLLQRIINVDSVVVHIISGILNCICYHVFKLQLVCYQKYHI